MATSGSHRLATISILSRHPSGLTHAGALALREGVTQIRPRLFRAGKQALDNFRVLLGDVALLAYIIRQVVEFRGGEFSHLVFRGDTIRAATPIGEGAIRMWEEQFPVPVTAGHGVEFVLVVVIKISVVRIFRALLPGD